MPGGGHRLDEYEVHVAPRKPDLDMARRKLTGEFERGLAHRVQKPEMERGLQSP